LNEALEAARARLDELTSAAEIASRANSLREQIQQLQVEKGDLSSALENERASRRAAERWAEQTEAELAEARSHATELEAERDNLSDAADRSMATAARLRGELKTAKDQAAAAIGARNEAETRLVDMQVALDGARTKVAALEDELERVRGELAATSAAFEDEQQALAAARKTERGLRDRVAELQGQLATSGRQLTVLNARNAKLEQELDELREAAAVATSTARDNLIAMENKIRLLNAALAEVGGGPSGLHEIEPAAGPAGASGPEADNEQSRGERAGDGPIQTALAKANASSSREGRGLSGPRVEGVPLPPALKAATVRREIGLVPAANAATSDGLQAIKEGEAARATMTLAELTNSLPPERRMHAQSLVADLDAKALPDGLRVTVAGSELFSLNSERIEESAYDTLGKVAELLDIYGGRPVLITGHTDAMGDGAYNQRLSERRAELVKEFLVEQFEIEADRLETTGAGESDPVASNASLAGRRANRRVEVTIKN
jgi:outer membrane protein OmpA-like peptidoglycan-associated protein/predicted  nucleic acid-binding Zn-ribbon protein